MAAYCLRRVGPLYRLCRGCVRPYTSSLHVVTTATTTKPSSIDSPAFDRLNDCVAKGDLALKGQEVIKCLDDLCDHIEDLPDAEITYFAQSLAGTPQFQTLCAMVAHKGPHLDPLTCCKVAGRLISLGMDSGHPVLQVYLNLLRFHVNHLYLEQLIQMRHSLSMITESKQTQILQESILLLATSSHLFQQVKSLHPDLLVSYLHYFGHCLPQPLIMSIVRHIRLNVTSLSWEQAPKLLVCFIRLGLQDLDLIDDVILLLEEHSAKMAVEDLIYSIKVMILVRRYSINLCCDLAKRLREVGTTHVLEHSASDVNVSRKGSENGLANANGLWEDANNGLSNDAKLPDGYPVYNDSKDSYPSSAQQFNTDYTGNESEVNNEKLDNFSKEDCVLDGMQKNSMLRNSWPRQQTTLADSNQSVINKKESSAHADSLALENSPTDSINTRLKKSSILATSADNVALIGKFTKVDQDDSLQSDFENPAQMFLEGCLHISSMSHFDQELMEKVVEILQFHPELIAENNSKSILSMVGQSCHLIDVPASLVDTLLQRLPWKSLNPDDLLDCLVHFAVCQCRPSIDYKISCSENTADSLRKAEYLAALNLVPRNSLTSDRTIHPLTLFGKSLDESLGCDNILHRYEDPQTGFLIDHLLFVDKANMTVLPAVSGMDSSIQSDRIAIYSFDENYYFRNTNQLKAFPHRYVEMLKKSGYAVLHYNLWNVTQTEAEDMETIRRDILTEMRKL